MNNFFKAVRSFLIEYLPKQKRSSANTISSYKLTLNLLVSFLREKKHLALNDIDFTVITREVIIEYLEWLETERKCSASTRNQRLAALRSFFAYSGIIDCINADSALAIFKIPRKNEPGKIVEYLSETALEALLRQPNLTNRLELRNGFFMILMYDTAARCDELLHLKVNDFQINGKHPTVYLTGKRDKTRLVPLMNKTVEHLKRYLREFHSNNSIANTEYLFYTVIHGHFSPMSPDTPAKFMKRYGESAKKECADIPSHIHPHMLRHTRAIHLYRNGMPLELISQFLGHSSIDSTRIYAFADTEMKRAAIEKADSILNSDKSPSPPIWEGNEDMILKLSGLK